MPEVTIKYKSAKVLKAIQELSKLFDIEIEKPLNIKPSASLPIAFAKNPDVKALAGIWEGRDVILAQLRASGHVSA